MSALSMTKLDYSITEPVEYRERLATVVARLDYETGRQWRRKPRKSIRGEQKANLLILEHTVSFALQVNHGGPCD